MHKCHDMSDAEIAAIIDRCIAITRSSSGRSWEDDIRHSVGEALRETRRESKVIKGSLSLEQRITRLEKAVATHL